MTPLNLPRRPLAFFIAAALTLAGARAEDAQPVDAAQMLQQLRQLREQTTVKTKADKQKLIQEVTTAAASGEAAVLAWEKAVMANSSTA